MATRRLKIATCATALSLSAALIVTLGSRPRVAVTYAQTPISGVVSCDGKPLPWALVTFSAIDSPAILLGVTDEDGRYRLQRAAGGEGLHQGSYRVTISKYARVDGTPATANEPPMRGGRVREVAPVRFSMPSESTLSAEIGPSGGEYNFAISAE